MATAKVGKRPEQRRWWVRLLRWLGGVVVATLVTSVAYHLVIDHRARGKMEQALAELDKSDPGWRLEEIEATRASVPYAENSAPLIVAAAKELPRDWPAGESLDEHLRKTRPNERLPDGLAARIAEALGPGEKALRLSEKLADRPRGRYRLVFAKNPLDTLLTDQQSSREIGALWRYESIRRSQAGDAAGALRAARAAFNAGRSLGDEPLIISQLIRTALVVLSADAVERALGQAQASDGELASWQALALEEDREPSYRIAMRGERAGFVALLTLIASGDGKLTALAGNEERDKEVLFGWFYRHQARVALPRVIEVHGRLQEAVSAPPEKQAGLERAIEDEVGPASNAAPLVRLALPAISKVGESHRRKHAVMRCLATALAVERYRLAHKRWPEGLQQLVPAYLKSIPSDPFDGAPLRYGTHADGVIVYSVGRDRNDDGGEVCDNPTLDGCDVGFRLYHPDRRRQPAPAAPAEKEPE